MLKDLRFRYWGSSISLVLAVLFAVFAYTIDFKPIVDTQAVWFQRSGSIMVLVAVAIEYELYKITSIVDPSGYGSTETNGLRDLYIPRIERLKIIGAMIAIIGTLILGYGDLIYHITNKST